MSELHESIENGPLTAIQITVVVVCWLINMLDGFDVLAISYSAPAITQDWALSPELLGGVFSAGLLGMALGAMFIGPYCDRIGRRRIVLICLVVIGVAMTATAWARSVPELMALRTLTGLGIGGLFASLTALVAEYSPNRHRNLLIGFLHGGFPVGALLGGVLATWLIPVFGWRSVFLAGGVVTALMAPVAVFLLPESPQFLLEKQPAGALTKLNRILRRLGQTPLEQLPPLTQVASEASTTAVKMLFSPALRTWTALLWLAFFCCLFSVYFLLSWTPKIMIDAGLPLNKAIYAGAIINVGGAVGMLLLGHLSASRGLRPLIVGFLIVGTACMIAFPHIHAANALLVLAAVMGFFVLGGYIGLFSVAARLYPTRIRAAGIGWAAGVGRFGAICGPYVGGILIGFGWSMPKYYIVLAMPLLLGAAGMWLLRAEQLNAIPGQATSST